MTRLKRLIVVLFLSALGASAWAQGIEREQAQEGWNPSRTWVFAVGILEWQHEDTWNAFPKEGRKDAELVEFFRGAGVPREQILFIKDRDATKERIQRLMARHLSRASEGDTLIFYFTGHGARDDESGTVYFANYDAGDELARTAWSVPSIFNTIERNFRGSRALLIADCCYSGALADEAMRRRTSIAYAALTSARSNSLSTGAWTFTELLLRGFRGNAKVDRNRNGEIELSELARYENARMKSVEGQSTAFATTRDFPADMIIAEVPHQTTVRARESVEVEWQGDWYPATILEVRGAKYRIHYLGYGSEWDEWIDAVRLRSASSVIPAGRRLSFSESVSRSGSIHSR